jgi:hypothetical protein
VAWALNRVETKVKRLFLWFAEGHNHPSLKLLDREGIDSWSRQAGARAAANSIRIPDRYTENLNAAG